MFLDAVSFAQRNWTSLGREGRSFVLAHLAGGAAGLIAALAWIWLGTPHGVLEWLVLAWLASPLALGALGLFGASMRGLQIASTINAIILLAGLSALSGALASPFLPWLILVPAEAALTRRPLTLAAAMAAGIIAILALLALSPWLPDFTILPDWHGALMAASLAGCLVYAGLLALNVRAVHVRAARKAEESEASYRFLADNAADLILRLSVDGKVSYASPASAASLGREASSVVGRNFADFLHSEDAAAIRRALVRASYFGEDVSIECRALQEDGDPHWLEMRCRPVARAELPARRHLPWFARAKKTKRRAMDVIAIARDITQRRAHEAALKRAFDLAEAHSSAKSRFLANMSHELRTPLNSILGFSEMIAHEIVGPVSNPRYREYAGLIGESGQYLLNLINDILDVAKIEAGKYTLAREPLNVAKSLERTLGLMMPQFREKGVELNVDLAGELPVIEADARAVRQILFNLLSNALKFTPQGGKARVRLALDGDMLVLEVSDTGIGIGQDDLNRLARPFEQAKTSYAANPMGTGLGLALVKSLAGLHGGSLSIASRLGAGTRVTVRLPAGAEAASPRPEIAAAA